MVLFHSLEMRRDRERGAVAPGWGEGVLRRAWGIRGTGVGMVNRVQGFVLG